jgi:hypothetical protein
MFMFSRYASHRLAVLASCTLLSFVSGCGGSGSSSIAPLGPENAQEAMEAYDKDGSGFLSAEELKQSPPLLASATRIDTDHDGAISLAELTTRMEGVAAGALYIGLSVRITENGRPVEGTTLTLIPEPFMGDACPTYSGTSGPGGYCPVESDGAELLGAPAGWYRAEVTKPGVGTPVVKGLEIASDTTGNRVEIAL